MYEQETLKNGSCRERLELARSPHTHPAAKMPLQVFQSIFEFLDENWSKLSPGVTKGLKDRPLVPVGARLIKAGRLFFRLKVF